MKILITGSAGLIGSEAARFYGKKGHTIIGIDNNMRQYFFGEEASTLWNRNALEKEFPTTYHHSDMDIRNSEMIKQIFMKHTFDLIIHTAAQPSHDWAAKEPYTDFTVNANGTLILLENFRLFCPKAVFIFISTNKVYGDTVNELPFIELETRYELDPSHKFSKRGIDETMRVDNTLHSLFGASKLAADILVQEYGKYFNLHTGVFRGGCLTGPNHAGAELHGFLAYLIKCILTEQNYVIHGYKGKQVRDNIHAVDLIRAFDQFFQNPRNGEVYNIGGSRSSHISLLEAIKQIESITGKKTRYTYVNEARKGDHIWYISDVTKFKSHYPSWDYTYTIPTIIEEMCDVIYKKTKTNTGDKNELKKIV